MNFQKLFFDLNASDIRDKDNVKGLFFVVSKGVRVVYDLFTTKKNELDFFRYYNTQVKSFSEMLKGKYHGGINVADFPDRRLYFRDDALINREDDQGLAYEYTSRKTTRQTGEGGGTWGYMRNDADIIATPAIAVIYNVGSLSDTKIAQLKADVEAIRPAGKKAHVSDSLNLV